MDFTPITDDINSTRPFTATERAELTRMVQSMVQDSRRIKEQYLELGRYNKWAVWSMVVAALTIGVIVGRML